jgi:hypothetical protein
MRTPLTLLLSLTFSIVHAQPLTQIWQSEPMDRAEVAASAKYVLLTTDGAGPKVFAADDFRPLAQWPGVKAALAGDVLLQLRDQQFQGYSEKAKRLGRRWKWPAPDGVEWMNLDGEVLYYGDGKGIHAMSTATGEVLSTRENFSHGRGLIGGSRIYFSTGHEIIGLDKSDLTKGWRYYCDAATFGADERGVFGSTRSNKPFSISADATSAWKQAVAIPQAPFWNSDLEIPAATADRLFFTAILQNWPDRRKPGPTSLGKHLAAFERNTGTLLWKIQLIASSPVAFKGNVALLTSTREGESRIEVRSAKDGQLLGSGASFATLPEQRLIVAGDRLFLITNLPDQKMQISAFQ